jgi:D-alanine transaminase
MQHPTEVYLNGRIVPFKQATVSVEDRGFQFSDGLYEVVRTYEGRFFHLDRHLSRLSRGAAFLELSLREHLPSLEQATHELIARSGLVNASLVIQVTRGVAPRAHAPFRGLKPTVVAYVRPANPPSDEVVGNGIAAITTEDIRWARCDIKGVGLVPNVLAKQRALDAGAMEAFFVRDGLITDGTATNVFVVHSGMVMTPPESVRILSGVTRAVALQICLSLAIPTSECDLPMSSLSDADEVFITGTSDEVTPVVRINGRSVGTGKVGTVSQRLIEAFRKTTRGDQQVGTAPETNRAEAASGPGH